MALKKSGLFYLSSNEPWEDGVDVDKFTIIELMGKTIYSRAYFKEEVLDVFNSLGMVLLKFHRQIENSELFGTEHTTYYIFKKS